MVRGARVRKSLRQKVSYKAGEEVGAGAGSSGAQQAAAKDGQCCRPFPTSPACASPVFGSPTAEEAAAATELCREDGGTQEKERREGVAGARNACDALRVVCEGVIRACYCVYTGKGRE